MIYECGAVGRMITGRKNQSPHGKCDIWDETAMS
jgi:hypothetical protein